MRGTLLSGLALTLFSLQALAADDVASAVAGTVKVMDTGTKTVVIKVADGSEHTLHFAGKTVAHGGEAVAAGTKDAFMGMKEGDEVIVHYTLKGTIKTADEVDHLGKSGLMMTEAAVTYGAHTRACAWRGRRRKGG